MKQYLSTVLALVCIFLVISLVVVKRSDSAQYENDAGVITDFSNRLDTAQTQIAICNGTILTYSNSLDECRSASLMFSNHLTEAKSTIELDTKQITDLNRQVAGLKSENQALNASVTNLTSQMTSQVADLTQQLTSTQASLNQANKDYTLLENRLRRDVAERVIVERKFNNPAELQTQMQNLKQHPANVVTAEGILAGLDVEVTSNAFHVISPN